MNEQLPPSLPSDFAAAAADDTVLQVGHLARGVRAIALVFTLFTCFINFGVTGSIGRFREIFADMLPDQALPPLTSLVIQGRGILGLLSLLLPLSAIACVIAVRRHDLALYALAGIIALTLFLALTIWASLFLPMLTIIHQLNGSL